jgi:hypothetical protein
MANKAHALDGGKPRRLQMEHHWPATSDARRWTTPMKTILAALFISVVAAATYGAENAYDFTVTTKDGQVLGSGNIRLPFKLGAAGKGTADWRFTPAQTVNTNKYWTSAKARLAAGRGKANAECKKSWFTLDFNPGWADNNVTMSWPLDKDESGTLYLADVSGGHPCALFRIARPAQRNTSPNGGPVGASTNSAGPAQGRHR